MGIWIHPSPRKISGFASPSPQDLNPKYFPVQKQGYRFCQKHFPYLRELIPGHEGVDGLGEVEVLNAAAGTADGLAVVGEEVEALVRVDHQLVARSALNI